VAAVLVLAACGDGSPGSSADAGADTPDASPIVTEVARSFPFETIGICIETETVCAQTSVAMELSAEEASSPSTIDLIVHNIVAVDSADLVINGAFTLSLSDQAAPTLLRERGGVVRTSIPVPDGALQEGENELLFRYRRLAEGVSGYRVLDLAITTVTGQVRPDFAADNPGEWPDAADAETLARGEGYFRGVSRDGGPPCGDCHTDSGSDLEYFAFTTPSIVARARFHLFERSEAEDISAYLRALAVERTGRVFQPPFQPGSGNYAAAGSGWTSVVDDDQFGQAAFGPGGLPEEIPWDWAASVDTFLLPAPVQVPTWFRWLPRELKDEWLDYSVRVGGSDITPRQAWQALQSEGSHENAVQFMDTAFAAGRRLVGFDGNYTGRLELLRFAAVKLWGWSLERGFEDDDHGMPDAVERIAPSYPYEVGFAFFEQAQDGVRVEESWRQSIEWWWVQLATHPGRGRSSNQRPLEYGDVLTAAKGAGLGPNALVFLHLLGSWEESLGELADEIGTDRGSVRLLRVPLEAVDGPTAVKLWIRFFKKQEEWVTEGNDLTIGYLDALRTTWMGTCSTLSAQEAEAVRSVAGSAVDELVGC
jgi:hypothetical protein